MLVNWSQTMTDRPIVVQLPLWPPEWVPQQTPVNPCRLHRLWLNPDTQPAWLRSDPVAQRLIALLGSLNWDAYPERDLRCTRRFRPISHSACLAALLVKLEDSLPSIGKLYRYLVEHPSLIWLLGFPVVPASEQPAGLNARRSLPTARHLTAMLRHIPPSGPQYLLDQSVRLILAALRDRGVERIDCISLDTKHILAWVKENNRKAYVPDRFNKARQPAGDRDCRLGCKRRRNQGTPATNPRSAAAVKVGEYYWGYGSGLVVCKLPDIGEFVLAELTQPFDQGDLTYFSPLMQQAEQRLGYRPHVGTFDAAFDAWYVYAHFYEPADSSCFAAVPFSERGGYKAGRQFSPDGLPLCAAHLPMPLRLTYTDRTTCLVPHERGHYVCPLRYPARTAPRCPAYSPRWPKGGCTAAMPISIGARLRYTLDRQSPAYLDAYRQRTAIERINAQAVALGIERPHLRNGAAIANQNTLIYTLINLRFLQRLRRG